MPIMDGKLVAKETREKIKNEVEWKNHESAFEILIQELLENKIVEKLQISRSEKLWKLIKNMK